MEYELLDYDPYRQFQFDEVLRPRDSDRQRAVLIPEEDRTTSPDPTSEQLAG